MNRLRPFRWHEAFYAFCEEVRKVGEDGTIFCFGENIGKYGIPRPDYRRVANANLRVVSA